MQVKQFLFRFCFRFWNDATFKLFKTLFLNTYLAVKNAPNWFKWFGKFSFFPVCKDFCHWTKRLYMRNWFFYLLTHNTCLLFVFWWLFNMVWNKTCIEKDSKYLVKLTKAQNVLSIGPIFKKTHEITILSNGKSWGHWFRSLFWRWDWNKNIPSLLDLATFKSLPCVKITSRTMQVPLEYIYKTAFTRYIRYFTDFWYRVIIFRSRFCLDFYQRTCNKRDSTYV